MPKLADEYVHRVGSYRSEPVNKGEAVSFVGLKIGPVLLLKLKALLISIDLVKSRD